MSVRLVRLLLCSLLLLSGCNQPDPPGIPRQRSAGIPATGDTLVTGSIGEASTLIPLLASDAASHSIAGYIYNGLVKYDKELNLVGDLARSWEVSPDGLVITFHLRQGVKWQDGHEFTGRDVLYTYGVTIDPKTPTSYAEDFKQVKKVECPDPYTVRVTYDHPFAPALASWGSSILPAHLLEGKDITRTDLARRPVGTGPYRLKEWVAGQQITLESFDGYFEGRPYLDRVVDRLIPDSSTMYLELKAGGIDMMNLTPVQYQRQTVGASFLEHFNKYRYPASSYVYMGYNLRNPLFSDLRVRRALTHAINKEELIQGVLLGMGQTAKGPYKPGTWAWNPHIIDPAYDPAEARRLLAQAGWRDTDGDGILDKGGKPFQFTVLTNQGNAERLKSAQIIQQRLRSVGIDMKIRVIEWASFITHFIDTRNFEAVILGWTLGQDPDIFDVWHSSKSGKKELNFIGYKNEEVDRLIVAGRGTFDQKERQRCYWRIQELLAKDQPYTFLYVPDALPVVSARIRGIAPAPAGIGYNFIQWYVPRGEQKYTQ